MTRCSLGLIFLRSSLAVGIGSRESWLLPSSEERKKKVVLCRLCSRVLSAACCFIFLTSSELTGGLRSWDLLNLQYSWDGLTMLAQSTSVSHFSRLDCLSDTFSYPSCEGLHMENSWGGTTVRTHLGEGVISLPIYVSVLLEYDAFFLSSKGCHCLKSMWVTKELIVVGWLQRNDCLMLLTDSSPWKYRK